MTTHRQAPLTPHLAIYCDPRVVLVAVLPDLVQGPRLTRRTELSPSLSRARAQLGAGPMPLLLLLPRRCLRMVFSIDCSVRTGCPRRMSWRLCPTFHKSAGESRGERVFMGGPNAACRGHHVPQARSLGPMAVRMHIRTKMTSARSDLSNYIDHLYIEFTLHHSVSLL